jgi:hypothetical protein
MNVNLYNTTDYGNKSNWTLGENKPNSNPNKPNLQKAKMNVKSFITKDYRRKDDFSVRINKPNLVRRRRIPKMNVNLYVIKDYENETAFRPKKTNPNKPNLVRRRRIRKSDAACQRSDICLLSSVFAVRHPVDCLLSMVTWVAIGKPNRNCQMNSLRKVVEKC